MLSKTEAEVYDRQIRLWGVNAQSRLRKSRVLMIGFGGTASEVAKILVLAGIDTLTIIDDQPMRESDRHTNLFCRPVQDGKENKPIRFRTHMVREKLYALNPLVKVNIDNTSLADKVDYKFEEYDLITIHSFMKVDAIEKINQICREKNIKFYFAIDFGYYGFMFSDLGSDYSFSHKEFDTIPSSQNETDEISGERPKKKLRLEIIDIDRNEKKQNFGTIKYVPFTKMMSSRLEASCFKYNPILLVSLTMIEFYDRYGYVANDHAKQSEHDERNFNEILSKRVGASDINSPKLDGSFFGNLSSYLSPVCAVIGGVVGQDIIRVLSGIDIPIYNTFAFNGIEMNGVVDKIGLSDSENLRLKPVVRDILEIHDD